MKWLRIPNDILLVDEITGEPLRNEARELLPMQSFVEFMLTVPLRDPEYFGKGLEALDARHDLRETLLHFPNGQGMSRRARAGDVIGIENLAHGLLLKWLEKPSSTFNPVIAGQLRPFLHAIKNAKNSPEELADD